MLGVLVSLQPYLDTLDYQVQGPRIRDVLEDPHNLTIWGEVGGGNVRKFKTQHSKN